MVRLRNWQLFALCVGVWGTTWHAITYQVGDTPPERYGRWIHYPWSGELVHALGPAEYRELRSDRNRYKMTSEEQERLSRLTVGIAGLSVGNIVFSLILGALLMARGLGYDSAGGRATRMRPIASMMFTLVAPVSTAVSQKLDAEKRSISTQHAPAASAPASE